jgi:Pyruvate/2-oxoacid:ferredoxin oxidoreductase delta subunit
MGKCKDYPLEQGCMFLGRAAETCVKNGVAREATVEECLAHIDRATSLGLSAGAYFIEFEQYPWGFPDADIPNYIGFCFCCPCCCLSTKFENLAGGELKHIMHQSVGWHCEWIPDKCTNCGTCVAACPRHFISINKDGKHDIYDACAGCGQCTLKCPNGALHVVQYAETKKQLVDYFDKLHAKW